MSGTQLLRGLEINVPAQERVKQSKDASRSEQKLKSNLTPWKVRLLLSPVQSRAYMAADTLHCAPRSRPISLLEHRRKPLEKRKIDWRKKWRRRTSTSWTSSRK